MRFLFASLPSHALLSRRDGGCSPWPNHRKLGAVTSQMSSIARSPIWRLNKAAKGGRKFPHSPD
eukprot:5156200-Pyramimonas_sp.AAC.1